MKLKEQKNHLIEEEKVSVVPSITTYRMSLSILNSITILLGLFYNELFFIMTIILSLVLLLEILRRYVFDLSIKNYYKELEEKI